MPTTWTAQKIHFLTQPELRALFRVITRRRDRALFLIANRHGLRASEVGLLRVDDLNFAQQRLTIHRVKRSLPGIYPLQADEITALKAYLRARKNDSPTLFLSQRGRPISRRQLDTLMKHYGEEAGIPASRWLPVVGALGVAAYAYRDTRRVGHTAIELFSREVALEDDPAQCMQNRDTCRLFPLKRFASISRTGYIPSMEWAVEYTDAFGTCQILGPTTLMHSLPVS